MWRVIQGQAPARRSIWACCADTSSDDGEHNTDNEALLLFGLAVVAPHLLSHLLTLDELALALTCRFAFDMSPYTSTGNKCSRFLEGVI